MVQIWNSPLPEFPREGLNPLLPSEYCQVGMFLRFEAAKAARLAQFELGDPARLPEFQRRLRATIREKSGCRYDASLPLAPQEFGTLRRDGYTITKLTYQSRPGIDVTALLYRPNGDGPFPAVVNMHGHNMEGKMAERVQLAALGLVRRGFVVLSVDAFGVYERATHYMAREYHGGFLGGALFNIGETLLGAQLTDNMRAVDLLQSLPFVRPDRIGATGGSGGGNQTMWLSAMDERIAAAMPVVSVGSFESYVNGVNCICELLPDGLTLTEEAGVLALIAPRPLRIGNALYDVNPTFAVSEMLRTYGQVEELYRKLGVPERLAYTVSPRVHGMTRQQREAMLGWFELHLKDHGHGGTVAEGELTVEPESELRMFASHAERPASVRSTAEHCRIAGEALRAKMLATPQFDAAAKRRELAATLRLHPLPPGSLHRFEDSGSWERYALESGGRLIPLQLRRGGTAGKFRLLLHPFGRAHVEPEALKRADADGATVVLADLFGTGETAQPNQILGPWHQFTRQLLWLGRSLPGEWTAEILELTRMLRSDFGAETVEVAGSREAGLCGCFAAALAQKPFKVILTDAPWSLRFCRDGIASFVREGTTLNTFFSVMLSIPGFLNWGDVTLAAALAAETEWHSPRNIDGTPYPATEVMREIQLLHNRLHQADPAHESKIP